MAQQLLQKINLDLNNDFRNTYAKFVFLSFGVSYDFAKQN